MKNLCALLTLLCACSCLLNVATAQEKTATLKAKFVLDGDEPKPIAVQGKNRDPFCANLDLKIKPIELGKDNGIKYLVMYIYERGTEIALPKVPVDKEKTIVLDNTGCLFDPPVLAIRAGQTLTVKNSDACGHNAKLGFINNKEHFIHDFPPFSSCRCLCKRNLQVTVIKLR